MLAGMIQVGPTWLYSGPDHPTVRRNPSNLTDK